jgi:hypothetical protein
MWKGVCGDFLAAGVRIAGSEINSSRLERHLIGSAQAYRFFHSANLIRGLLLSPIAAVEGAVLDGFG